MKHIYRANLLIHGGGSGAALTHSAGEAVLSKEPRLLLSKPLPLKIARFFRLKISALSQGRLHCMFPRSFYATDGRKRNARGSRF